MGDENRHTEQSSYELEVLRRRVADLDKDRHERRVLETDPRRSEEQYRTIFENAPVGIFHSSLAGKFIDANRRLALMFGHSSSEKLMAVVHRGLIQDVLYVDPEARSRIGRIAMERMGEWVEFEGC